MMRVNSFLLIFFSVILFSCTEDNTTDEESLSNFVFVKGLQYETKDNLVNIGDFEILDHPVTNREYKFFIDATGYQPPLHWQNGIIPSGKDSHPVIFVNRMDADAYTTWLTMKTGKVHRLPTSYEFELAARAGNMNGSLYFWGDEETVLNNENVNFNKNGDRKYDQWEKYLSPARSGMKNSIGLYQMAGNVWQFVDNNYDPAMSKSKYRIETLYDIERFIIGGSWASAKGDLICGRTAFFSPGLRIPDLGIRLVREPQKSVWKSEKRSIIAVPHSSGKIGISWAYLNSDENDVKFNIYRLTGTERSHNGIKLNKAPIFATSFLDTINIQNGSNYHYRVVALDKNGKEKNPSEWGSIIAGKDEYPVVVKFKPISQQGGLTPVFGDLEGLGKSGCVIRLINGNKETSQDPGIPVQLEAFSNTGRSLWRKNIAEHSNIFGSASNCPFNVWDMNGDGKDEVITLLQIGDENYVTILDGMSGDLLYKNLWDKMATDFSRSSTRTQMSIAYLDGVNPSIVTMTGIYENEIISAYDNQLNKLWTYKSFMETSGSGGHKIEIADVDNDGKQEIVYGSTCLNSDGSLRWSIYKQHPDIITIDDHMPDRPGLEVLFIVESALHAGIYMVDADTGEIIWKNNREDDPLWSHGHVGWTSNIWDKHLGSESITNRMGGRDKNLLLFNSKGDYIMEGFPTGIKPIEWDGDKTRELLGANGKTIGKFNGREIDLIPEETPNPVPNSSILMVADLFGDFRGEMVIRAIDSEGNNEIKVVSAPYPIENKFRSPQEDLEYKLWIARNLGGGYGSIHEYELIE